jgi:hypothetical protein
MRTRATKVFKETGIVDAGLLNGICEVGKPCRVKVAV